METISGHYDTAAATDPLVVATPEWDRCAECFTSLRAEPIRVAVVNPDLGLHGVVHESCFLDNDDVLERE